MLSDGLHTPAPSEAFNFARHVLDLNASRAQKVAYKDDSSELTYGDLASRVRRLGDSLLKLGLQREQRVLIVLLDCIDWPVAFLGALYAGVVPVPVNTLLTPDDYAYFIDHSGASAIIASRTLLPVLTLALDKAASKTCQTLIVSGSTDAAAGTDQVIEFSDLIGQGNDQFTSATTHCDAIAFWLYSSGSTGRPKGVVHTHANLYWTSELFAKRILGLVDTDIIFSAAKMFFAYGLGNSLTFPLTVGASTLLLAGRPTPSAVFARLQRDRPTVFCGAPTLYAGMLAAADLPERSTVAMRLCTSAGEALPRDLGERFSKHFGADIIDGLGSTEMLHIFLSNRPGDVRYGTSGTAVPGYEVELRDENGRHVARGEIGDLWVKGPSSALMYWNDRSKTRETFHGAWLRTGDKYVCGEDGAFVYAGRNDDMLKISGQYVSPFEVESTLALHPSVLETAVIGVFDTGGLCKCKAYVVLRDPALINDSLSTELQLFVKARLAPFKRPHHVEFVSELPKTATGKIQRFRLREQSVSAIIASDLA